MPYRTAAVDESARLDALELAVFTAAAHGTRARARTIACATVAIAFAAVGLLAACLFAVRPLPPRAPPPANSPPFATQYICLRTCAQHVCNDNAVADEIWECRGEHCVLTWRNTRCWNGGVDPPVAKMSPWVGASLLDD